MEDRNEKRKKRKVKEIKEEGEKENKKQEKRKIKRRGEEVSGGAKDKEKVVQGWEVGVEETEGEAKVRREGRRSRK